tara:strand:- start:3594 stop:4709 length:1116 start_codon:yes stop_codon:yes gene_type:complete
MPRSYQPINPASDVTTTRTFLHEVIPITGTILTATYGTFPNENNIKNYTHGMFQSVYDYPVLSSSANHIFDLSCGYSAGSPLSSSTATQNAKKINMYNLHAQVLLGFTGSTTSSTSTLRAFENDLVLDQVGTMKECFFIDFSRLLVKDEIKKNTFSITISSGSWDTAVHGGNTLTLQDSAARVDGTGINTTNGGDYGVLYDNTSATGSGYGVIFYQAGICVLSASAVFPMGDRAPGASNNQPTTCSTFWGPGIDGNTYNVHQALFTGSISGSCDALRHRIHNISFNNTTQINSTLFTCRAGYNAFNYSSNPTYLSGSKIRVKNVASDNPVSYVTTVGLYNAQNELLAIAKLSEPLKKSVDNELAIRVRLDY